MYLKLVPGAHSQTYIQLKCFEIHILLIIGYLLSPPGRAAAPVSTVLPTATEPGPVHRTWFLSQTCRFQLSSDSRSGRDTLNDRL
jgi:hypothetical protein